MFPSSDSKKYALFLAAAAFGVLGLAAYPAYASTKSAPAPKAAPARAAAPARPAAGGASHGASTGGAGHAGGATTTTHSGPTANGTHSGPTANGTHSGPTTGHPATTTSHPTTTAGGSHPGTAGGGAKPGGNVSRTATGHVAPAGSHTVATRNGGAVTRRADGRISDVHDAKRGMDVHHGLDGGRRVSVERADHSRVVAERGRRGYVERRYNYHGHDYGRRAYYWHGHEYNRYYRGYYYHGAFVNVYAPGFYYAPAFYGWAYNPWAVPVAYGWGWGGSPWFGFYGAYFTPYPVYAGPAFWLADYLIAQQLQAAYAAQAAEAAQAENYPPTLNMCDQGSCGNLAWDGKQYNAKFDNGAVATFSVVSFSLNSVVLKRTDPAGASAGNQATYTGIMLTPTSMAGTVTGVYQGKTWNQTWHATSTTPVELASLAGLPSMPADSGAAPALSPDVKAMVADEVKAQIALENAEAQQNTQGQESDPASSGIARMLGDGHPHVFVAGDSVDVVDANSAECALSDGDVLQFSGPAPPDGQTDVSLVVLASKGKDKECQKSATVTVAVTDLQEMQNHLRETIDQGMQELQAKQGKGGLPAAPPSAAAAPTPSAVSQAAPPAEKNGEADVNQELSEADKADQEAAQGAPAGGSDTASAAAPAAAAPQPTATVNIAVGQTIAQVTTSLGQPLTIINLGAKKIYKYQDMKITFKEGKVSDVE